VRVPNHLWEHIQSELYRCADTRRELQEMREDILHGSSARGGRNGSGMSDPTAAKGVALAELESSAAYLHAGRIVRAIDSALARLGEQSRRFYQLKYEQGISDPLRLQAELHISSTTLYAIQRRLIVTVGYNCGWIKAGEYAEYLDIKG
jgi:hypothetical protein